MNAAPRGWEAPVFSARLKVFPRGWEAVPREFGDSTAFESTVGEEIVTT